MTNILRRCWVPFAILIITSAILFTLVRGLTPWAKQYKSEIEQHLSVLIGQPVTINTLETTWYWFEPVVKLNQVVISDAQHHAFKLKKLLVGINVLSSLWHWEVQPGILYIDRPNLVLRQVDNCWQVDGLGVSPTTLEPDSYGPLLGWLLAQQKIIVNQASVLIYLSDGTTLPVQKLNLSAVNKRGRYRLKGGAKLAQKISTEVSILADIEVNPSNLANAKGHGFMSVQHLLPTQWQSLFPPTSYRIDDGVGDIKLWFDVAQSHFQALQAQLKLTNLAWHQSHNPQNHVIQALEANLAWKPTVEGWQLSSDQIKLHTPRDWPDNTLLLNYFKSQQLYRLFVKTIELKPLLASGIPWPESFAQVLAADPVGELNDIQVDYKENHLDYVLTRFNDLAWKNNDHLPGVSHLSGVLYWQPTEGRLEFDSVDTVITPSKLPPITFSQFNAGFEWKELSHGLRVSMDRLVLQNAELTLSARGALDEPFAASKGLLRLSAEFAADNAHQWLAYIPANYLKPKLDAWLKTDIVRMNKASGLISINGALADFPFDNSPGEFLVNSHISGLDLFINKQWPLSHNIETYLRFDKRNMQADILQADLQGILLNQMNLRMDDIGKDRETLLIHGKVSAPANKIQDYVFSSPLKKKLAKLKMLDVGGDLALDLKFEVPLYPENDKVLARGYVVLNDNTVTVHHNLNDINLQHLSGILDFDEQGIIDSALQASLLGHPVNMLLKSVRQPKPYTEVRIEGETTIDLLNNKFHLPVLSLLQGHLNIESILTLTDDPHDLDHLQVKTNLQGVAVDLPPPLGKSFKEMAPLVVDLDFNPQTAFRLRVNYNHQLSGDLSFVKPDQTFLLDKGEVRLGGAQAYPAKTPGIQVFGHLPSFKMSQWLEVLSKVPSNTSTPRLLDSIRLIDVLLDKISLDSHEYPHFAIRAIKSGAEDWSIRLLQQDIAAKLYYHQASNSVSGSIAHLTLPQSVFNTQSKTLYSTLNPSQIPSLNLTFEEVKFGKMALGQVDLKTTTNSSNVRLEYCKVKSPGYLLVMKGDWKKNATQNSTQLQAEMKIQDLEKSLQSWNITPVVEAHRGTLQFKGGWQGPFHDFSLKKAYGELQITLDDGRITNLSPETEEKLGLGKLLSILSLQTIPRRLKLDFSDLAQDGYSFDTFKGGFILKNGAMHTEDSYIEGPVAYASMKGELDLIKQLYDVDLLVSPHITASLPIVATIAGGPIAGLATWVASKIINQGMQKISAYTYKVSGPWQNPVVQQVSIIKKPSVKHNDNF